MSTVGKWYNRPVNPPRSPVFIFLQVLAALTLLPGCAASQTPAPPSLPTASAATASAPPLQIAVDPNLPLELRAALHLPEGVIPAGRGESAPAELSYSAQQRPGEIASLTWVYALAAAFPSLEEDVPLDSLISRWKADHEPEQAPRLLVRTVDLPVFTSLWGPPGSAVQTGSLDELLKAAWQHPQAYAILPFDLLEPRWKVLRVNGSSPLEKGLDLEGYPLALRYSLTCADDPGCAQLASLLPQSNRQEDRLAVVILTGTTALVRRTALRMEEQGILYPGEQIRDLLRSADLTHISNEVSFSPDCPPGKPLRGGMTFCSRPEYLDLLKEVGADVIELTGNHLRDYGSEPLLYTLSLYRKNDLPYYGGGQNLQEAQQPLRVDIRGNRLAFIGCNIPGPDSDFARSDRPGANPCDFEYLREQISGLKAEDYIVIFTFQHFESENLRPQMGQRDDFALAADMGADIVSGSQSHFAQGMTFRGKTFIHYGLGNLFFDQMESWLRPAFIDRHYFYNNRYISTELIPLMREDYAVPRLMTPEEKYPFLEKVFAASQWEK